MGILPNARALLHLAGCVPIEAHDEWQCGERRHLSEASMASLTPPEPTVLPVLNGDPGTDTSAALTAWLETQRSTREGTSPPGAVPGPVVRSDSLALATPGERRPQVQRPQEGRAVRISPTRAARSSAAPSA